MATNSTSFTNTPQAGDDSYSWDEDTLLSSDSFDADTNIITLNVMSNDLGGKAKSLWSISDVNGNDLDAGYEVLKNGEVVNGASAWELTDQGNSIRINDGQIEYKIVGDINALSEGETLHDVFNYTIRLANGTLSEARVTIDIQGQNDAPVANDSSATVNEDSTVTAAFAADDPDSDDNQASLTYSIVDQPAQGSVAVNGDGTFTFDATDFDSLAQGDTQDVTFTYKATDSHGADSEVKTVTITVTGVNDDPVSSGAVSIGSLTEDDVTNTITGTDSTALLANATDVDNGATLSVVDGTYSGEYGSLVVNGDGSWTYTLDNSDPDTDALTSSDVVDESITVQVTDEHGATVDQIVNVSIAGADDVVNHAPVAVDDTWFVSTNTDADFSSAAALANDSDVDSDALTITRLSTDGITWVADADDGTTDGNITITTDNGLSLVYDTVAKTFTYTTAGISGDDTSDLFHYEVSDGNGGSDTGDVNIALVSIGNGTTADTINLTADPYDADADSFSYIDAKNGTDNVTGGSGTDTFLGGAGNDILVGGNGNDFLDGGSGDDTFTGGLGNDTIDVSAGNDTVQYNNVLDAADVLIGFDKIASGGQDVVTLDVLFDNLNGGIATVDRAARVALEETGSDVALKIDTSVSGDGSSYVTLLTFQSVPDITNLTIGNLASDDIKIGSL